MAVTALKFVNNYVTTKRQLDESSHIRLMDREPTHDEAHWYCAKYCDDDTEHVRASIEPLREKDTFAVFCDCEPDNNPKVVEIMILFFLLLSILAFIVKYMPWILGFE